MTALHDWKIEMTIPIVVMFGKTTGK